MLILDTLSKTFFSIPELIILHFYSEEFTSGIEFPMPELLSKGGRNWSSIPDFISKVKELTSGIEDQFLPFLEGNSSIGNSIPEVNSSL